MSLTRDQVDALCAPLDKGRVKRHRGNDHLEAWDVRRHLLRVFGWGGWSVDTLELSCICEKSVWKPTDEKPFDGRHMVIYRAQVRLTIRDALGVYLTHFDDGATGDAVNQPVLGDAHDLAMKAALSQGLKRCAVNLGDRYGLSLYNDGSVRPMVGKSLAHPDTGVHNADDAVNGGELEPQPPVEDETTASASSMQPMTDPYEQARAKRAAQVAEENDLTSRAQRLAEKAAEKTPPDRQKAAAGERS